jgi:3-oxoacyl-[acyl-carrier-protein] synthase-3
VEAAMTGCAYLRGLAYELEEPRGIERLDELQTDTERLNRLTSIGLAAYSASRQSPAEMAAAAAQRTLWKAKVKPGDVDLLVYASSSFSESRYYGRDIDRLLSRLKLDRAFPIGVTLSECSNLVAALEVAATLVRAGRCRHALLITTDKVADGASRIVAPEVGVASDSAASILVTNEQGGLFELLAVERHVLPLRYEQHRHENVEQYLHLSAQGVGEVCAKTMTAAGKTPADFTWLISNNFNTSISKLVAMQSGIPAQQTYSANISRFGHSFAADNLINLADCLSAHPPASGDLYMLLSSGPHTWGGAVLRKV